MFEVDNSVDVCPKVSLRALVDPTRFYVHKIGSSYSFLVQVGAKFVWVGRHELRLVASPAEHDSVMDAIHAALGNNSNVYGFSSMREMMGWLAKVL